MNRMERPGRGGQAHIHYKDGDFQVVVPGAYVVCAITGATIPLDELKYWSVAFQESYADAAAAAERYGQMGRI